jgi:hypothetical protein
MTGVPHTGAAVFACSVGAVVIIKQCCDLGVSDQNQVTPVATVATVWPTEWLELLPTHRHAAASTVTGAEVQNDLVDKRGHASSF